jgi:hypothetical protein
LHQQDWVVHAKPAFGGPTQVLRYLGRHTHRVATSNHRLLAFDGGRVLRRVFLRVLPNGFVRIRHFG